MNKKIEPFRMLELHLQFQKLEEKWEDIKKEYENDQTNTEEYTDRLIKLTAEKIKVLSEIYSMEYEA
jgi:hypothetical protein